MKTFKNFLACKIVVAANHRYPGNIQRLFRLRNCLSRKSSISWKYSETFCQQNCLSRKSSISWKYSKSFSPAKLSQQQPINILKMFKNFLACKIVVAANQRYSEKFKDFSACKIVLAATHQYSENVQKLFRLQNCRSRKSAISWKHSKIFPPAKTSQPQTICILETFKDFFGCKNVLVATIKILKIFKASFACKNVLAAKHLHPGKIQRLFRLQNCLSRKPSVSWNYSKTFSAAKISQQQPIKVLKLFKGSFACKIVFAAKHLYPRKIQRLFRLQNCLSSNPS